VARITRKELKSDKFALEVEHTVTFFEEHQKDLIRYGGAALGLAVLIAGYIFYSNSQHAKREDALSRAIQVQEAPVGPPTPGQNFNFPTQDSKDQAALKAFADVQSKFPGSDEAEIAEYYIACIKSDEGKFQEAEKSFQEVMQKGSKNYASLAKLSLAQIAFAEGRNDQGESILRDLMNNPTIFVSKEQAGIALARGLSKIKPAEARRLLDPLRAIQGAVGQEALGLLAELPPG
jgi:predicted negative regulator of RcsB-dependent stress response